MDSFPKPRPHNPHSLTSTDFFTHSLTHSLTHSPLTYIHYIHSHSHSHSSLAQMSNPINEKQCFGHVKNQEGVEGGGEGAGKSAQCVCRLSQQQLQSTTGLMRADFLCSFCDHHMACHPSGATHSLTHSLMFSCSHVLMFSIID
jgi:hypothetical protein